MRPSVEQVIELYFQNEERTLHLEMGDVLFRKGDHNECLYYVVEGQLSATREDEGEEHTGYLLIPKGDFTGVQSFLESNQKAAVTIVADEPTTLVRATAQDLSAYEAFSLEDVLIPIFGYVMNARQKCIYHLMAREGKEQLHVEGKKKLDLLGQFSAGVAHELNNAIAVLEQGARWLPEHVAELMKKNDPILNQVFEGGFNQTRVGSRELRERTKAISRLHGLPMNLARKCAHARLDDALIKELGSHSNGDRLQEAYEIFEIGSVLGNMGIASEQASAVVDSMRSLGAANGGKGMPVDLDETIHRSLSILCNITKGVEVDYRAPEVPVTLMGNKGEFVQVWTNLIRNGCDAMRSEHNPNPKIAVTLEMTKKGALITISDNGPGIPEHAFKRIFQPNYTTKKSGLKFGLGIGLPIVKRIIESYGGHVTVANGGSLGGAVFEILIPLSGG